MWKGGQALGSVAMDCAVGGAAECGTRLEKMGSYVVNHPGDFFGSLIDYKDLSQGNYAKWAGHLAPSIVLTVATVGGGGLLAKGGEAAGLAAEASDVAGEAGGLAAGEAAGEAGGAALEAGAGKAVQSSGEAAGDAAAGTEKAAAEAGSGANEARAAEVGETCNSFVPTTAVLLANGQHEPIEHIKVGDKVEAGDPGTGKVLSEPVDRVIIGQGSHHMVAITIPGDTILTTYNHPFWLPDENAFVSATSLHRGNRLQLESGQVITIDAVNHYDEVLRVYNLSVDVVHTFFVGQQSVLVHNCGEAFAGRDPGFRSGVRGAIGDAPTDATYQAHHVFPVQFGRDFARMGIDVNRGEYGSWVEKGLHEGLSNEYAKDWGAFFEGTPSASDAFSFARELAGKYGFDVHF
jgi:hypothetical protein